MEQDIITTDEQDLSIEQAAERLLQERHIPSATYRVQFNAGFAFGQAQAIVEYLRSLGVSDLYASPIMQPRAGSTHGYDITNHSALSSDLGSAEQFDVLAATLRKHEMGLLLDTVPNHMGIGDLANVWWMDVLENGPSSFYAHYFDIDWRPVKAELENKVLIPILGDQYGDVLERGELKLKCEDGAFTINYWDHCFPVAPRTYSIVLEVARDRLLELVDENNADLLELRSILTALSYLPPRTETDPARLLERSREKEVIKRRLAALYAQSAEVRQALDETIVAFNGTPEHPASFDWLDQLIEAQAYRLAFWRVATEEINYRRFFDINDLAAIRVELPEVLQATHQLFFDLLAQGKATGLRIDHPDGLWDPERYFLELQRQYMLSTLQQREITSDGMALRLEHWLAARQNAPAEAPDQWPLYVVAEKILSEKEPLPRSWAVYGTTGYDFLNQVNGIFVNTDSRRAFNKIYSTFIGKKIRLADLINSSKKQIMLISLASEINALSHQLNRIAEKSRRYRDFTLVGLTFAVREIIASLSIYRTYINPYTGQVSERDQQFVEQAVEEACRRNPRTAESLFYFIRDTLLLRNQDAFRIEDRPEVARWIMKFQQLSGPVMAKGVEDTSFYIYNRLVSLNEVGGHPEHFGLELEEFHASNRERQQHWPHTMLASSTHDTKRSEDVRARINVLSEIPDEWNTAVTAWARLNATKKTEIDGQEAPDRNDEYLLYQVMLGFWPLEEPDQAGLEALRDRLIGYMEKATREAKVHTSWVNTNRPYEAATRTFVERLFQRPTTSRFLREFRLFQRRVAWFGQFNSLSQTLLKLTSPGMPDIYQGTELWDFSLVDPDNRRPVDYEQRQRLLSELDARRSKTKLADELLEHSADGRIKLYLIASTLRFRREHPALFQRSSYEPLTAEGTKAAHVCAFARRADDQLLIAVAPRLIVGLTDGEELPPTGDIWGDTWLPLPDHAPAELRNLYTGEALAAEERDGQRGLSLSAILARFPVALLAG